jgi:hypothetical protein
MGHFVPALNGSCSCPPMGRDLGPNPARYNGPCRPDTKLFWVVPCLGRAFFSCFGPAHQAQPKCTPISTPRSNPARRNPIANDAQDHPAQSFFPCTADAPPISSTPQTQSTSRRHGRNRNPIPSSPSSAQDHHRLASHRKYRTTSPSHSSHFTRQPRPNLAMFEYFPFYAPAPPRSCDARV